MLLNEQGTFEIYERDAVRDDKAGFWVAETNGLSREHFAGQDLPLEL